LLEVIGRHDLSFGEIMSQANYQQQIFPWVFSIGTAKSYLNQGANSAKLFLSKSSGVEQ